jgi:C4-type Zn-finger protein
MIMKRTSVFLFGLAVIVLASASFSFGQEKQMTFERKLSPEFGVMVQGPGQVEPGGGNTWTFVTSEMSFDRLVKGSPYSAQAVTETTQVLSDGNRIVNTNSSSVYRDGEGRTRREQTLKAIGNFSPSGEPFTTIAINDPVTGVSYVLEPQSRTARKVGGFRIQASAGEGGYKTTSPDGEPKVFTFNRTANGDVQTKPGGGEVKMRIERDRNGTWRSEELGTQTIEGVNAVGTRTTITIPAGQIGNERAIEIVDERWFSPDLKTIVMTRHTDPRAGETVYRLTNINRAEPDHSLFEVPGDYTIREDVEPMKLRMEKQTKPELN